MNIWQKIFIVIGIIAILLLIAFPPQVTLNKTVKSLPITEGYPIDWLIFFMWFVVIVFVTGLGVVANKSDHF
ncbi:hypothetical protein ACFL6K_04885 [Candidatus Latescibacterota bacterium]